MASPGANGTPPDTDSSCEHAESLDAQDPLRHLRQEFHIPTKADLKRKTLTQPTKEESSDSSIYLCGNSLGLQPKRTHSRIQTFLTQWRTKAVTGHFVPHDDSPLAPFLHIDDAAAELMAPIVGARTEEVAVMGTLTSNLLLMMASFYRPTQERYKIILEGKAFPSDHYAIDSQIALAGFNPREAMILIEPNETQGTISTQRILDTLTQHASSTALVLLPGIQFYTGQYFDIETITSHAHSLDIPIGWDCAHAAGNVDLRLHDWDVDFAVWCTYKYLNSGPGAIAGLFVHERHGRVDMDAEVPFRPRLCGWWGADKETRFQMENKFVPRPGAAGYQLSNPSALDCSAVVASLEVFGMAGIEQLRKKSVELTAYLERLLLQMSAFTVAKLFSIITPESTAERGAQLSIRLQPGLLDSVLHSLEEAGVVVDERKPDVIRVAPAPLYNSYLNVWHFVQIFEQALQSALKVSQESRQTNGAIDAVSQATGEGADRGTIAYGPNAS